MQEMETSCHKQELYNCQRTGPSSALGLLFKIKIHSYLGFDFCPVLQAKEPPVSFNISLAGWVITQKN